MITFHISPDHRIGFGGLSPLFAEWISHIPQIIESACENERVEGRLFPSPVSDNESLRADWKAHVQPDLYEWFQSARSLVAEDVKNMQLKAGHYTLTFPMTHADGWLNALNQARLALAEMHSLSDADLNQFENDAETKNWPIVLQISFYALMQQCLIDYLEKAS